MAEIQIANKKGRRKLATPRLDLTPMVDLGFILITFFLYTTTLNDPRIMDINMPYNPPPPDVITAYPESSSLTIIPTENNSFAYYEGRFKDDALVVLNNKEMRNLIRSKKSSLAHLPSDLRELHVVIKPADNSKYEDLVYVLDEMNINHVQYYAIADLTEDEAQSLTKKLQTHL